MTSRMIRVAWGAALALAVVAGAGASEPQPVMFTTTVRVEVGGDGRVTDARPDEKLPTALHSTVLQGARALRFQVPKDEAYSSGVTFVQMRVCMAPAGQDLAVATQYLSNGPRRQTDAAPRYPADAARGGKGGDFKVVMHVAADGEATVESISNLAGGSIPAVFKSSIRDWVASLRYDPELVSGQPVATRVEMPIVYRAPGSKESLASELERRRQEAAMGDVCRRATGGRADQPPMQVALDSPFVLHAGI